MIINGKRLLTYAPVIPMMHTKVQHLGVSHGLTEAGYDLRIKQTVDLDSGNRFVLASTVERFDMPDNLLGVVHDKSTWARRGLSVLNTVIEPGWQGWLTLELVYHGSGGLRIEAGSGIAQVIFHELAERAQYRGRYNEQPDHPVKAIFA